jgi:menaquinone-9 beta-reductase
VTASPDVEVLVVGGGPAGAVTAAALARRQMSVLLADNADHAVAGYDVLVSGPALSGLRSLDLPLPARRRPVETINLRFGANVRHVVSGVGAAVCDRAQFRLALGGAAVDAGVRALRGSVTGVAAGAGGYRAEIETSGGASTVLARHIVIATGAGGGLRPAIRRPAREHADDIGVAETVRLRYRRGGLRVGTAGRRRHRHDRYGVPWR